MSSSLNAVAGLPRDETSRNRLARWAGFLYLCGLPTTGAGVFSAQSLLENSGSAAAAQIAAMRPILEFGILAGSLGAVLWLALAVAFYELFRPVSDRASKLLIVFMVACALLMLAAYARRMDAIALVTQGGALGVSGEQLRVLTALAVRSSDNLLQTSYIFSAVWLLPLGYLVFRSRFLPKTLGVLLILGVPFYLASFIGAVLQTHIANTSLGHLIGYASGVPEIVAELVTALWLLIRGTRGARASVAAPGNAAPEVRSQA